MYKKLDKIFEYTGIKWYTNERLIRNYLSNRRHQEVNTNMANRAELVDRVAKKTGLKKKEVSPVVDAVFEVIQEALQAGEKVQLIGFGNFEVRERAARKGRNPQTGEEITISSSKVPAFKPGKALKDAVKN